MERVQAVRERGCTPRGSPSPRPLTAAAQVLKGVQGDEFQRLRKTPRVFHRCQGIRHIKRNELRANLLPCILQTPSRRDRDDDVERLESEKFKKRSEYQNIIGTRSESESEVNEIAFLDKNFGFQEWDPAWQAVNACDSLKDLVHERCSRLRRPIDGMVNTGSDLPFVHKDQAVDLQELANVFTIEIQSHPEGQRNHSAKGTKVSAFASLQIASRVPLLVKDPATEATMETQSLPNDVHTLRLDLNPQEVRHIACNMKSRHFKGSDLEERLTAVVHPERGTVAKMVTALEQKEIEAQGLQAVLNNLLREVSKPLPSLDVTLESSERLQTMLCEPRRSLGRLLSVSDRLATLAQPLVASMAHAIDQIALVCVREVDRLSSSCNAELEKLLKAFKTSEEARRDAEERIEKMGGRTVGNDFQSRLKNMENELHQHARTHAKLIEEKEELEARRQEDSHAAAALRVKVRELEQEVKYLRQRGPQAWTLDSSPSHTQPPSPSRPPSVKVPETDPDTEKTEAQAASPPSMMQIQPPPAFAVANSMQTETEFFFCRGDDAKNLRPSELSFQQFTEILETVNRLFVMLSKYEWNDKTATFLHRSNDDLTSEEEEEEEDGTFARQTSISGKQTLKGGSSNKREAEIRRLKGKVEAAQQQAAATQLKEQVAILQLLAKNSFDFWLKKMLQDLGSSQVQATLPDPDKLFSAVMEVTQTEGLQRRVRELEDKLKRLIPMSDRLKQKEGVDSSFWKRVMRSVRHSMTARRGSSAMKADSVQRAGSGIKMHLGNLDRVHGELALIWQALPPKPAKMAAGTLLLRPMAPQVLQEAVRNFYLKSCGRHRQVEQAVCNLCRLVLQFSNNMKVLLFAVMCDIATPAECEGKLPKVTIDVSQYVECPSIESLSNLPFDAVHTMSELMSGLKNAKRSKQFAGAHDGSLQRIPQFDVDHRGKSAEVEDSLLPIPLILAASGAICNRSKLTAQYFNLMLLSYARRPVLLSFEESQELDKLLPRSSGSTERKSDSEVVGSPSPDMQRSVSRKSYDSLSSKSFSSGIGDVEEASVSVEALMVSHLIAYDRLRRHPDMWEETNSFVDSLWEAIMKTARKKTRLSTFTIQLDEQEIAEATMAAQVTTERFRLQVPESLVETALLAMQPALDLETDTEGKVTKEAVRNLMHLWQHSGGAASMCIMESHALWAALWAMALERAYEVKLMGKFFGIFDESGDDCLQFDEFVNFMAHIAPAVLEADCASLFMAVADDTSADMTQEVFLNLVQRVGVSSDLDSLESLVKAHEGQAG